MVKRVDEYECERFRSAKSYLLLGLLAQLYPADGPNHFTHNYVCRRSRPPGQAHRLGEWA